jgi:hypothetical protein
VLALFPAKDLQRVEKLTVDAFRLPLRWPARLPACVVASAVLSLRCASFIFAIGLFELFAQ